MDTAALVRPSPERGPGAGPRRGARWAAALAFAGIVGGFGGMALIGAIAPERITWSEDGPTTCPFKLMTGQRCPLCGMTRATFRMARGDFAGALHLHPLAPILLLVVIGGTLVWLYCTAAGRELPRWMRWPRWLAIPALAIAWVVNIVWGTG